MYIHTHLDRGAVLAGEEAAGVDGLALREQVRPLPAVRLRGRQPLDGRAARRGAEADLHLQQYTVW